MSTTYDGDHTNHPTSITIPEDGDTMDAASVNAAFEANEDNIDYIIDGETTFNGEKLFQNTITVRGGTEASNAVAIDMAAGTARKPWFAGAVGGAFLARLYTCTRDGVTLGGFEFVEGAVWDSVTDTWDFDTLTTSSTFEGARLVEALSTGGAAVADNNTGSRVRMKKLHIASGFSGNFVFDAAADTITTTGNFVTAGFVIGDVIKITGTVSNNANRTVTNVTATVLTTDNGLVNETVAAAGVVIRTAPWAPDAWDAMALGISCQDVTATQAGLLKNTIYPGLVCKAWVNYATPGGGGTTTTFVEGVGFVSAAHNAGNVEFTLRNAMAGTDYLVQPHSNDNAVYFTRAVKVSSSVIRIIVYDIAGAAISQTASAVVAGFTVWGKQA